MWTAAGGQERLRLTTRWFWCHCTALLEGLATDSLNHRVFDRFLLFLPTTDGGSGPRDRQHFQLNVRGAHKFTLFTNPRGIQGIQGVVHDEDDDGAEAAANPWANKIHSWKSIIKSWFYFWSTREDKPADFDPRRAQPTDCEWMRCGEQRSQMSWPRLSQWERASAQKEEESNARGWLQ